MDTNKLSDHIGERRGMGFRQWAYWISTGVSTLLFILFMTTMLTVPGIAPSTKAWMLVVVDVIAVFSLGLGTWRFDSTDAPALVWPLGGVLGVIVLVEMAYCTVNIFLLATGSR